MLSQEFMNNSRIREFIKQAQKKVNHCSKKIRKGEKGKAKEKSENLKFSSKIVICAPGLKKTVLKPDATDKKGLHVAQMPLSKLQLI